MSRKGSGAGRRGGPSETEVLDSYQLRVDKLALGWTALNDVQTPAEIAMMREDGDGEASAERAEERLKMFWRMLDFCMEDFGKMPDKRTVTQCGRRVLALAKFVQHPMVQQWTLKDLARMCGDGGKGTVSARVRKVCNKRVDGAGAHGKATWQQGSGQRASSAAAALGNRNRRGGK